MIERNSPKETERNPDGKREEATLFNKIIYRSKLFNQRKPAMEKRRRDVENVARVNPSVHRFQIQYFVSKHSNSTHLNLTTLCIV